MPHPLTRIPYGALRPPARRAARVRPAARRADRVRVAGRLNVMAALLILAGGYVHFCLYRQGYRFIPKIGVSFLLQFSGSAILAAALLLRGGPVRLGSRRLALSQLIRSVAIAFSVGDLAALGIAHTPGGLFQFREVGLRPAPQTLVTIVVESLAAALLAVAMWQARRARRSEGVSHLGSAAGGGGMARAA